MMRFIRVLSSVLFLSTTVFSSTPTPPNNPISLGVAANSPAIKSATKHEIYNNIMTDSIICAKSRHSDGSFLYEKCARYASGGMFPFCVYMVVPSNATVKGHDVYGCVYAHRLPKECAEKQEFYSPFETVRIKGKEYKGAMMCCMDNFCNQVEEPVFTMVRMKDVSVVGMASSWPVLVAVFIVLTGLMPLIHALLKSRTSQSMRRTERAAFMDEDIRDDRKFKEVPDMMSQSMRFPNLKKMQETTRGVVQPMKYGTASTTNHEEQDNDQEIKDLSRKDSVFVFQKDDENPRRLEREIPSRYEHLAQRMIEHGPYTFDFDPVELGDLFDSVGQILLQEPTLIELTPEVDVYGNLEGSYGDLFRWMHKNGWPPKRKVLFLGGLTHDEEPFSLETISLIFAMKKLMPQHVFILRGASEVYPIQIQDHRFTRRITRCLVDVIQRACGHLPLAATIQGTVLFTHGGVSPKLTKLKQINDIKRPLYTIAKGSLAADLIFSQASLTDGVIPGSRGWQFKKEYEPKIASGKGDLNVRLIVRSRNSCIHGFQNINDMILSIWSAPGYPTENKAGTSLSFNHDLEMTIQKMGVFGTYTPENLAKYAEAEKQRKEEERRNRAKNKRYSKDLSVEKTEEPEKKRGKKERKETEKKEEKKEEKK